MQKIKKTLIFTSILLFSFFVLPFISNNKVSAQNTPTVSTTGYSVMNINTFILNGVYSNNTEKKPFTTYFEYKKNNSNLNEVKDREETVKIIRKTNVEVSNNFYSTPSLQIASTYYFRAVGYFNDNSTQKFYGNTLSLQTGPIYVTSVYYPLVVTCGDSEVRNIITNRCEPIVVCGADQTRNIITGECEAVVDCSKTNQVRDIINGICVDPVLCTGKNESRNIITNRCEPIVVCGADQTRNIISGECEAVVDCTKIGKVRNIITGKCEAVVDCSKTNQVRNIITGKCETPLKPITSSVNTPSKSSSSKSLEIPPTPKGGLIVCSNTPDENGVIADPCDFNAFIRLLNKVIRFILFNMAVPISAVMFAYAGFLLVTAGGSGEKTKAKNIFTNTVLGLVIASGAWLIVKTLLSILSDPGAWSWIGF